MSHNRSRSEEPVLARRAPAMHAIANIPVSPNRQAIMDISQSSIESSIMDVHPVPVVQQAQATAQAQTQRKGTSKSASRNNHKQHL